MSVPEEIELSVQDPADPAVVDVVVAGLSQSNVSRVARRRGEVVDGADGRIGWAWVYVSHLWVREESRGTGLGARIMCVLESAARERGCEGSWLDTFSFQARPFYEAVGYRQFGELPDFPPGHSRHFM